MSLWMFLKIFGDICVVYSVLGGFPTLFYHEFSLLWPAILCGMGAALATFLTEQGKGEHRFWGMVLPLLSLVLVSGFMDVLILLPALGYTLVIIMRGDLSLDYYSFREVYVRTLTGLGIFTVLVTFFGVFESMASAKVHVFDHETTIRFALLYAAAGVVLLRQLRMGSEGRSSSRILSGVQLGTLVLGIGGVTMAILALERALQKSAWSIIELLIQGIGFVFSLVLKFFVWLGDVLFPEGSRAPEQIVETTGAANATAAVVPPEETVPGQTAAGEAGFPWWLALLFVVVMVIVLIYMLRTFHRNSPHAATRETVAKTAAPERKKKENRRSNRGNVRRAYREFLKSERKKGLKLRTNQTSADILEAAAPKTDAEAAARLREVYLRARYDEKAVITADDVQTAKDALRKTRE